MNNGVRPLLTLLLLTLLTLPPLTAQAARPGSAPGAASPDPEMARPIDAAASVWIEELTWLEVRDAIRAGMTTAIIPTGGIEQNGPYLVTSKHNVIIHATAEATARRLGNALVAPVVAFVPEGDIDPPAGHMRYPGTISVREATFRSLLSDIASSLRAHGFTDVVLIGDSGGNQDGMRQVAEELGRQWAGTGARIHYIPEYYDWPERQAWLEARGYHEEDQGLHDELSAEAIMMTVDPATVRMEQRMAAGRFSINGIELAPAAATIELGRRLVEHVAEVTAAAIRRSIGAARGLEDAHQGARTRSGST